jgi:hypothetical protein
MKKSSSRVVGCVEPCSGPASEGVEMERLAVLSVMVIFVLASALTRPLIR